MSIAVMKQALEALEDAANVLSSRMFPDAAAALRAAIEQAEEPVAYLVEYLNGEKEVRFQPNGWGDKVTPLYAAPSQWVGLTDEERYGLYRKAGLESYHLPSSEVQYKYDRCIESYARAIEAKLKEKNCDPT